MHESSKAGPERKTPKIKHLMITQLETPQYRQSTVEHSCSA